MLCSPQAKHQAFAKAAKKRGVALTLAHSVAALSEALEQGSYLGALICDEGQRADLEGMVPELSQLMPVVVAVDAGDVMRAVQAMQQGAYTVMELDASTSFPDHAELLESLDTFVLPAASSAQRDPRVDVVCAPDSPMQLLLDMLPQLASSGDALLFVGVAGVGKELLARTAHALSDCRHGPFIKLHCSRLSLADEEAAVLLTEQLKLAAYGTLFLEAFEQCPDSLHPILQQPHEARMMASSRPFHEAITQERSFWLAVQLPALSERPQDVSPLFSAFLSAENQAQGTDVGECSREAMALLERHDWPGNVAELQGLVHHLCATKKTGVVQPGELPAHMLSRPPEHLIGLDVPSEGIDMAETLDQLESRLLTRALFKAEGNKAKAARLLGINRTTLVEKLKRKQIAIDE